MICKKTRLNFLLSHTRISPPAKEVGGKGMKGRAIERRGEKKTRRVSRTRLHSFSAKSGMKRERESIKCTATSLPSARRRKGRKGRRRKISLKSTKISVARQVKDAVVHRAVKIKKMLELFFVPCCQQTVPYLDRTQNLPPCKERETTVGKAIKMRAFEAFCAPRSKNRFMHSSFPPFSPWGTKYLPCGQVSGRSRSIGLVIDLGFPDRP